MDKKAQLAEIIPGKGSGQLEKRVLRFIEQKGVKALYHRVEKDSADFGRVFVHVRWKYPGSGLLAERVRPAGAGQPGDGVDDRRSGGGGPRT